MDKCEVCVHYNRCADNAGWCKKKAVPVIAGWKACKDFKRRTSHCSGKRRTNILEVTLMATKCAGNLVAKHAPKRCNVCGRVFVPHSGRALYCRPCRVKGYKWIKERRKGEVVNGGAE